MKLDRFEVGTVQSLYKPHHPGHHIANGWCISYTVGGDITRPGKRLLSEGIVEANPIADGLYRLTPKGIALWEEAIGITLERETGDKDNGPEARRSGSKGSE